MRTEKNLHKHTHTNVVETQNVPKEEASEGSLLDINGTLLVIAVSFVIFTLDGRKAELFSLWNRKKMHTWVKTKFLH